MYLGNASQDNRDQLIVGLLEGTFSYIICWWYLGYCVEVAWNGVVADTVTGIQYDDLMGQMRWNFGY